jgi:eukaryotic-like serine/threonine-protein kinase
MAANGKPDSRGWGLLVEARQEQEGGAAQGRMIAGQYRITRKIGVGGMGEVFLAEDLKLHRPVAIKTIRPELLSEPKTRARFVREARLASSIVHPYVATVFDVVEDRDRLALVMEYIEGRSLDTLIEDPAVTVEERLRLSVEVAEALVAIHRQGLVHRDLKPSNVLLTQGGHVKVLDFGLARPALIVPTDPDTDETQKDGAPTDGDLTGQGVALGTLAYMSPEQLRGEDLDARSDVFSFGVILYQLATKKHPFKRPSGAETISAILNEPPGRGEDVTVSTESASLQRIALHALEKDRRQRYQSAELLAGELKAALRGAHDRATSLLRGKRKVLVLTSIALATACLAAGTFAFLRTPPVWKAPRLAIAVLPFVDKTGAADGPARAAMAADLLVTDLRSSRLIRVIGPDELRPILAGVPPDAGADALAGHVAQGLHTDYVLAGTLYQEGRGYTASAVLIAAEGAPALPMKTASASTVTGVVEGLAGSLRREVPGASPVTAIRDDRADLAQLMSHSDEATMVYERALESGRDRKLGEAIELLERAVSLDPGFALAHAELASALDDAGYGRRAREAAARALGLAPRGGSPADQRLALTLHATWARVYGRKADVLEATARLADLYPDEPDTIRLHARALGDVGDREGALATIDRAIALDPARPTLYLDRAMDLTMAERYDEANDAAERARKLYELLGSKEGVAHAIQHQGTIALDRQNLLEAVQKLDKAAAIFTAAGCEILAADALHQSASADALAGNLARADERLERAAASARDGGNLRMLSSVLSTQGVQQYTAGSTQRAEGLFREALDIARQLENDDLMFEPLSNLASMHGYVGRLDEARTELEDLIGRARSSSREYHEVNGQLLLADLEYQLGNIEEAVKLLGEVLTHTRNPGLRINLAQAHQQLGEIHEARDKLGEALTDLNESVTELRGLSAKRDLGYSLALRARVQLRLGRGKAARADLDEAERLAQDPSNAIEDLAVRCALARALSLAQGGQFKDALYLVEHTMRRPAAESPPLDVLAGSARCAAAVDAGRMSIAVAACRLALDNGRAWVATRVSTRSYLALALLSAGQLQEAKTVAVEALAGAQAQRLLLPAARAAGVLTSLPSGLRPPDIVSVRQTGEEALQRYLDFAPAEDRAMISEQHEIRRLRSALVQGT